MKPIHVVFCPFGIRSCSGPI